MTFDLNGGPAPSLGTTTKPLAVSRIATPDDTIPEEAPSTSNAIPLPGEHASPSTSPSAPALKTPIANKETAPPKTPIEFDLNKKVMPRIEESSAAIKR